MSRPRTSDKQSGCLIAVRKAEATGSQRRNDIRVLKIRGTFRIFR